MQLLFDVELAKQQEAQRRFAILGDYALKTLDPKQLRTFAADRCIPQRLLLEWKHQFTQQSLDGLLPQDWMTLSDKTQVIVRERFQLLGEIVDATTITDDHIKTVVSRLDGSLRKADRLIRRYQIGGVWGLAPERHPEKAQKRAQQKVSAFAAASDNAQKIVQERYTLITPFLGRKRIPNQELKDYGKEKGVSWRTLRKYLHDYRTHEGRDGLLPKEERSDKGRFHAISQRMIDIIMGIRLSHKDIPLHQVHTLACQKAELLVEPVPSLWQARQICASIPKEVIEIADGRYNEYRNRHRTTYRYYFDGSIIIYQLDFTRVDVLVEDIRRRSARSKSKEIRPRLTICLESSSRLIMGFLFTYDDPTSYDIACVLHNALLITQQKSYGGIPHAAWVDKGSQFISRHMHQIAHDFKFDLHDCTPYHEGEVGAPQQKGRVERFFRTLNQELWSTLPGYVHSNPQERNPHAKAELTLKQLVVKFQEYLASYHRKEHSETGQSPLQFWGEHCFALPANPRDLDILLLPVKDRVHLKEGIKYTNRVYWSDDLAATVPVDSPVLLRAAPAYTKPDTVEVFYQGQWVCTANARDSEMGRAVTGQQVLTAQRQQSKRIHDVIEQKQDVLNQAEQEIEKQQASPSPLKEKQDKREPQHHTPSSTTSFKKNQSIRSGDRKNAWDTMTRLRQQVQQRSNEA
jgi:putative transposase